MDVEKALEKYGEINERQFFLMKHAHRKYGDKITMCGRAKTWAECFTVEAGELWFWFNVEIPEGKSTYVIREKEVMDGLA